MTEPSSSDAPAGDVPRVGVADVHGELVELVTSDRIEAAARRLDGNVRTTPVVEVDRGLLGTPDTVVCKLELLQHAGSFKARGAYELVSQLPPGPEVVAASGGNFGLAVAWAARACERRATVFVPSTTSPAKRIGLESFGADVRVVDGWYADALLAAQQHRSEVGGAWAHAYDQPEIVAGAGTCARELSQQRPDLDTVLVAVGGGGLIGGFAGWYGSDVRIIGVETDRTPTMHDALRAGRPVDVEVSGRAADALGARRAGRLGFAAATRWVDQVLLVADDDVLAAQRRLWDRLRVLVEPAAAVGAAALLSGAYRPTAGERVGIVLCGGNVDPLKALEAT